MEVVREELETTQERLAQLKRDEEQLVVRTLIDGAFQFTPGPNNRGGSSREERSLGPSWDETTGRSSCSFTKMRST